MIVNGDEVTMMGNNELQFSLSNFSIIGFLMSKPENNF